MADWPNVGSSQTLGFGCSSTHSAVCQVLHAGSPPGCIILGPSSIRTDQKLKPQTGTNTTTDLTHVFQTNKNQKGGVKWLNHDSDPENAAGNMSFLLEFRPSLLLYEIVSASVDAFCAAKHEILRGHQIAMMQRFYFASHSSF